MPATWSRISLARSMVVIAALALGLAISPRNTPYAGLLVPVALGLASLRSSAITLQAIPLLVFCSFVEIVHKMPVAGWVYVPIAILISGPIGPRNPADWRAPRLVPLIAVNALILALFLIPWSTRKPFMRDLFSIKPGMTLTEANRIMADYQKGTGWIAPNTSQESRPANAIVFRHSDDPAFNSDWGVVTIHDDKVVAVGFWPD